MKSFRKLFFALFFVSQISILNAQNQISDLEKKLIEAGMVNVQEADPSIWVELKYATTDNFTKVILYQGELNKAYLHPLAAQKLAKAQEILKKNNPNLSLLIYDAARPRSIQHIMYNVVKDTPQHNYVAEPTRTGLHNYGMAVDLTLCDDKGIALDMGTPFDFFGQAAAIRDEEGLVERGVLTKTQVANRRLLRKVMTQAGFLSIQGEWWHFNAVSLSDARAKYDVLE